MVRKRDNLRWWIATVVSGLGVCLGIALGFWQLDRAAQKIRLQTAMQEQAATQELDVGGVRALLKQSDMALSEGLHRSVKLQGQWLAEHTVYLDNRQMQGRPGFFVFTPLQLDHGDVVLVQRGWIARNFQDRQKLQTIDTPNGLVTVEGVLAGPPGRLYALAEGDAPDVQNPRIRQNLDISAYAHSTGLALWPFTVIQKGSASEGLLREWPEPNMGVATHYGYAFQWFAIAAVLAAMIFWFQFLRPARAARQRHATS